MKYIFIILLFTLNFYANSLKYETSPYLQQHSDNPVNWFAWNEKTLALAKKENKPIFLSIGYSTCHWCHVMAEESFKNEKLAKLFNKYFISIKVDKEEMPHIDAKYQELFKNHNNHAGGWPLNIFMTPNLDVFYMSAYIPSKTKTDYIGFDTLLESLHVEYKKQKFKIIKTSKIDNNIDKKIIYIKSLIKCINDTYDDLSSGFGDEVKFPEASKVHLMLDLYKLSNNKTMKEYSLNMLDAMSMRGIYDHVDGGFFRYSVDVDWEIPHFEKMLYNQAELIGLYSRAYRETNKSLYKKIVQESISFTDKRFMQDMLYYSASDAVVEFSEGKYFVFSKDEIQKALNENKYKLELTKALSSSLNGNFDNSKSATKIHLNFIGNSRPKGFDKFVNDLSKVRATRKYPFIDKKINTAWNSLMIEALYKASSIDEKYINKADKHLKKLTNLMFDKGELYHQTMLHTHPKQKGFLEDYSFMISALISGYEVTKDKQKIAFAHYLFTVAKQKFYKNGVWYMSQDNLNIKANLFDGHYISPLSKMLQNLIRLYKIDEKKEYINIANDTLNSLHVELQEMLCNAPAMSSAYLMMKNR